MRSRLSHYARIAAALVVGLGACTSGNSPATGNFTVQTENTVIYRGALSGTFSSWFSASIYGNVIGTPIPPSEGWRDHFEGRSGSDGIYRVQYGIVPARWEFHWSSGPCTGLSASSMAADVTKGSHWVFQCIHEQLVIRGVTTYDEDGNGVSAPCCGTDAMTANMVLHAGDIIQSEDARFTLEFQGDGNLVLYNQSATALWASGTAGSGATEVDMQGDGNLVIYAGGTAVWATPTAGHPGAYLLVQNDGNVVIYDSGGSPALWATNTCCQ